MQDITLRQSYSSSYKTVNWLFAGIVNVWITIVLLFCTVNTLTSVPIDKIVITLVPFIIAVINPDKKLFTSKEFLVVILFTAITILSSAVNLIFSPILFFFIIGLCFSIILSKYKTLVLFSLYYALFMHIVIGIVLLVLAFLGLVQFDVSVGAKGFDFLYATHGFTSTVQTYGTLCITWILLYLLRQKMNLNTGIDKFLLLITLLAILLTFNRSTYLFLTVILFFEFPLLFWSMACVVGVILVKFWNVLTAFLLSSNSITSRFELLEGFKISYLQSNSLKVYLFGRGNNQITQDVAERVKWWNRTDLENGYTMILNSYGLVGLIVYIIVCLYFIFLFVRIKKFKEAFFLFFYFFVTQYITQEFVATTFYMFLAVMLFSYNTYLEQSKSLNHQPLVSADNKKIEGR